MRPGAAKASKAGEGKAAGQRGRHFAPEAQAEETPQKEQEKGAAGKLAGLGSGDPLDPALRRKGESALGISLSEVRLHRDRRAADLARSVRAAAFTAGNSIVMRPERYAPYTEEGRSLLGHELAHVAQNRLFGADASRAVSRKSDPSEREADAIGEKVFAGEAPRLQPEASPSAHLQRQEDSSSGGVDDGMSSSGGGVCEADEGGVCEEGTGDGGPAIGPPSFDPQAVDVAGMTNEELNAESVRVDDWIGSNTAENNPDYSAYQTLRGRLRGERVYRVRLGHLWMNEAGLESPTKLYMIGPGANGRADIIDVDLQTAFGVPQETPIGPIMTEAQYRDYLTDRNIQEVDEETYRRDYTAQYEGEGEEGAGGLPGLDLSAYGGLGPGGMDAGGTQPFALGADDQGALIGTQAGLQGRLYRDPFDVRASGQFSQPLFGGAGSEIQTWRGAMAETGFQSRAQSGFGLFLDDLNAQSWNERRGSSIIAHQPAERNFPVFDFERGPGSMGARILGVQRISVKTSLQAAPSARYDYYRQGLEAMLDAGPRTSSLQHYIANQPGQAGTLPGTPQYAQARSAVLQEAFLAVNADDVAGFRAQLADTGVAAAGATGDGAGRSWTNRPAYRRLYDAVMRENPITIGGQTFSSTAALDAAQSSLTPEQYDQARREVGRRAAARVISSGRSTAQIQALRDFRASVPPGTSDADLNRSMTPELVSSIQHGEFRATGGAAFRGGAASGLIAVVTTAGVMVFDEADHPDWEQELATSGEHGFVTGGLAAATEQIVLSQGSRYIISRGGATWLSPAFLGRAAPGAAAGIAEIGSMMFFEDREHSGLEYGVRGTRAAALGVASYEAGALATAATTSAIAVILSAGGTGAATGSVVPGWGTAIGFIVGLGVGIATYYALDRTVPGGREDWEPGEAPRLRSAVGPAFQRAMDDLDEQARREGWCADCEGSASSVGPGVLPQGLGYTPAEPLGAGRQTRQQSDAASWIDGAH